MGAVRLHGDAAGCLLAAIGQREGNAANGYAEHNDGYGFELHAFDCGKLSGDRVGFDSGGEFY